MRVILLAAALILPALVAGQAPALAETCEITDLSCWGSGKKCNIKFRNKTGLGGGSGAGEHNQISRAATLHVSARKDDDGRAGSNTIKFDAGSSKTLNLDKKKDFLTVRITAGSSENVTMDCADIRDTLNGSGNCDVFAASSGSASSSGNVSIRYYLAYKCAGGSVVSDKPKK